MEHIIVYHSGKEVKVCNFEFMQAILSSDGNIMMKDGREYFYVSKHNG